MKKSLFVVALLVAAGCANSAPSSSEAPTSSSVAASTANAGGIDSARAKTLIKEGAPIIDVRSADEFASGHLEKAVNIPVNDVSTRLEEFEQLAGGDKSKPLVLYCGSGKRAKAAQEKLQSAGFTNVVNGGGLKDLQ